jgi:uncharacterized protein (TIGR02246 family)
MTSSEKRATSPQQVIERFADHLGGGDLDALIDLYEPDAAFVPEPGVVLQGVDAIRGALEGFLALNPTIRGEIQGIVETGGVALVINRWWLEGTGSEGTRVEMSGVSADVVRRQPDDSWRVLIDDPWGGGWTGARVGGEERVQVPRPGWDRSVRAR